MTKFSDGPVAGCDDDTAWRGYYEGESVEQFVLGLDCAIQ